MRLFLFLNLAFVSYFCQGQAPILQTDFFLSKDSAGKGIELLSGQYNENLDSSFFKQLPVWRLNVGDIMDTIRLREPTWHINMDNFLATGQSNSYFGEGLYTNLALENKSTILGLPIRLRGSLIAQNKQINTRLSTLSVEFDYHKFIEQYYDKAKTDVYRQAFAKLPIQKQNDIKIQFLLDKCQRTIQTQDYQNAKFALLQEIDSFEINTQSRSDSARLDSLKGCLEKIARWENQVDSTITARSAEWEKLQETYNDLQNNVSKQMRELQEKVEVGSINTLTKQFPRLQNTMTLFLSISRCNIGSYRLSGSAFDISSMPVHGLGVEIRRNRYYASFNIGREGRQNRNLPEYVRNIRLAGEGRKVMYLKAGIGMPEKNHLHLSFSNIQVPGASNDSLNPSFTKRNTLLSLDSRYLISNSFYIDLTGAVSSADFTGKSNSSDLMREMYAGATNGARNAACLIRSGWRDNMGKNDLSIGYQLVGPEFATLGNLFLLKNRNTLRIEGKRRFWQNKFQIKITYAQAITNNDTDLYPGIRQNQFSGDLSIRLGKQGTRIWGTYSPNYYLQQASGIPAGAVYQLNLVSLGAQIMFPKSKKGQWATLVQATNFNDQSQFGDTSTVSGMWYGFFMQTWTSDQYTFTGLANIGIDQYQLQTVKDLNIDLQQSIRIKRSQVSQGVQIVKRHFDARLLIGGSLGFRLTVIKKISIGAQASYLFNTVRSHGQDQFYMSTTLGWQF